MANSGRINTPTGKSSYFFLQWQLAGQNINNNTSTINVQAGLSNGNLWYSNAVRIDGGSIAGRAIGTGTWSNITSSGEHTLWSGTVTVQHNNDGTKAFSGDITGWLYSYGSKSASGSWDLPTIPRASNFTVSPQNLIPDDIGTVGVIITPLIAGATHDVKWDYGTYSKAVTDISTSTSYAIPMDWINASPNVETGTGTVTVTTKNGSTTIGSKSATFTLTALPDVAPTIGDLTLTRIDNDVPTAWGVYVQNHSAVKLDIVDAAGAYNSTISKYEIKSTAFSTATATLTTDKLPTAGECVFAATVTDSRGRTATKTVAIHIEAYEPPTIQNSKVGRCLQNGELDDDGAYALAQIDDTVSSIAGKNVITRKVEYRRVGQTSWTAGGNYVPVVGTVFGGGNISVDYSYEVQVTLQDSFGVVSVTGLLPTAYTTVDYRAGGKGIAFGKVSEADGFDCALETRFRESVTFDQIPCTTRVNGLLLTLDEANPGTYWPGTTWQAFGAGRVPIGVDASDPDFNAPGKTGGAKAVALTESQMPTHSHGLTGANGFANSGSFGAAGNAYPGAPSVGKGQDWSASGWLVIAGTGGGQAHSNVQPSVAVYMWLRTA